MKISFSRAREKNLNHFSSRISRDRDSCQCLSGVSGDYGEFGDSGKHSDSGETGVVLILVNWRFW